MAIEKNQNPGSPFRATSQTALPIWPIWPNFEVAPKGLPGFSFFQLSWVPNILPYVKYIATSALTFFGCPHIFWVPSHFLGILFQS